MFQIDWAQRAAWESEVHSLSSRRSDLQRAAVRRTALFHWEEHCLECAIPTCYTSCSLYVKRGDGGCSRFSYGIFPNPGFSGLFDFGADIRFRRWGKLETRLYGSTMSVSAHRSLDRLNRSVTGPLGGTPVHAAAIPIERLRLKHKTLFAKVRNKYFTRLAPAGESVTFDAFVLECFSPEAEAFRLTLEYFAQELRMRHSFDIHPGWNFHTLPASAFKFTDETPSGKITLFPENDAEKRLIFTWLDLVQYEKGHAAASRDGANRPGPNAKVKCVAWDLDNTLWKGILAEDTESRLVLRPGAKELIMKLDERGILQTVVSKNNFADAWSVVGRLGLQDYFLHPAISWSPKSTGLREVAAKLNINLDTFALIDDSPFERAEVQTALPQVRVYSEDQIDALLTRDEFQARVSDSSKERRASYLTEIKREAEKQAFDGDYEEFLRSCNMKLSLFIPREEQHIRRCLELIQRANQLNLSNVRYTEEEFRMRLSHADILCVALACRDRFGDYGIVGFASVDEGAGQSILQDMVLSCRVAQKRVEHAFVGWLAKRTRARGGNLLAAEIVRTDRNQPIAQVFEDLYFRPSEAQLPGTRNGTSRVELLLDSDVSTGNIVILEVAPELLMDEPACLR